MTLTEDEFKCEETEQALLKRKDAQVAIEYTRKVKGCGVIKNTPKIEIDGFEYYSCLCHKNFIDHTLNDSLWLHSQFKNGVLAYSGPLMDQPNKYIELMKFIDRLKNEYQEKLSKEQSRTDK